MLSPSELLELRSRLLSATREFFFSRNYLEVETPVRIRTPAIEDYIDAEESGDFYLRTSPELHMKRMLGMGMKKIFQVGPCFRKGEKGRLHNPEFTMLEWYNVNLNYREILVETKELLTFTLKKIKGGFIIEFDGMRVDVSSDWEIYDVSELYKSLACWDPSVEFDQNRFDIDMIEKIEPFIKRRTRPSVLMNYPAKAASLARLCSDNPLTAERWEIYIAGVELANAFGELVDFSEQKKRFEECILKRKTEGRKIYPIDEEFMKMIIDDLTYITSELVNGKNIKKIFPSE